MIKNCRICGKEFEIIWPNSNRKTCSYYCKKEQESLRNLWRAMLERCKNTKAINYKYYGGRGIKVCDDWKSFNNFFNDMYPRPKGLTIDRIDNNKGYSKENCRWATRTQQNRKVRGSNKTSRFKGVSFHKPLKKWYAQIKPDYKAVNLGYFENEVDAAVAYNEAAKKYFGEDAYLNNTDK